MIGKQLHKLCGLFCVVVPAAAVAWSAPAAMAMLLGRQPEPRPHAGTDSQIQAEQVQKEGDIDEADPPEAEAADDEATATEVASAVVTEVEGSVDWAPAGTSALIDDGWTAVEVGDQLEPGTIIRTGLRSHVNLRFGETTYASIRSATFAAIELFDRTEATETVRISLGYGTVRGRLIRR